MTRAGRVAALVVAAACRAPSAHCEGETATVEQWRADLSFLAAELPRRHVNAFHHLARRDFEAAVARLEGRLSRLEPHEFRVELARLVASIGDGHTWLDYYQSLDPPPLARYPIALFDYDDGLRVIAAAAPYARALGARLVRVGSVGVRDAFDSVATMVARDNGMWGRFLVPSLLGVGEVLHAFGLAPAVDRATFEFEDRQGTRFTLDLMATSVPGGEWVSARGAGTPPLYLEDPSNRFWHRYLADSRTLYVQVNAILNKDTERLPDFSVRMLGLADSLAPDRFVLDIRRNFGGDNTLTEALLRGIEARPALNRPDRLFVIVGRRTFSAAMNLATRLEQRTRATFVGEPTGSSPNHYGDGMPIRLPHTGLTVYVATRYWEDGGPGDLRPWITPATFAPPLFADYAGNRDAAMEAILRVQGQQ